MSEAINYVFSHKEIAEILIKKQDLHEGHWSIYIEFGLGAANIASSPEDPNLLPSAIVPVKRIGIHKFDQPNQLSVDAALVNPIKPKKK
jgi:hypothetical protein